MKLKLSTKLLAAFLATGILPLMTAGLIALNKSAEALEEKAMNQLISVRDMKNQEVREYFKEREANLSTLVETVEAWEDEAIQKLVGIREAKRGEVESYFSFIENQVLTFSRNAMVVEAMEALPALFEQADASAGVTEADLRQMRQAVEGYYREQFGPVYEERNGEAPRVDDLLAPLDKDSIFLQYQYIAANPNPLGSKEVLDAAPDGTAYSAYHGELHPIVRDYLQRFEYYDIFLVDTESGDIVYSVFKELDYATSLKNGPYAATNFGRAFREANQLKDGDAYVIVDYEPYGPSYEAPASFIASPIFKDGKRLGVALFQMPIDRLNRIMSTRAGLGRTGETYIVGPDHLMRSDSFLDPENRSVQASFLNPSKGRVETQAVTSALAGQEGSGIITDYNGNLVLSAFSPLEVAGFQWALIAELDVAEAFNPKKRNGAEFYSDFIERNGYYDLFLIGPEGHCFYSVAREADYGTNFKTGPYASSGLGDLFGAVLRDPSFKMVDFEPYAPSGGAPASFIGMPLTTNGRVDLVVALQLSPDKLNAIMQSRSGMGESGETYLVGPDFRMRSDSYLDPEGRSIEASFAGTVEKNGVQSKTVQEAHRGEVGVMAIEDYNGNRVLSAYAPLDYDGLAWAMIAEIDEAEAFAAVREMRASMGLLSVFFVAVVLGFAFWISRSISRPIMHAVEGITLASNETSGASSQVSSASQSLAEGASEQAASLEQTSSSMEEMKSMVARGEELASRTSQNAQGASEAVNRGQVAMRALKGDVDSVSVSARQLDTAMEEIKSSSTAISQIIKTIDEIAFQTNILALNAAVEAARAGEAGAGFAVVADEVRTLAGRASEAASQTATMIQKSVESSKRGVEVNTTVARQLENVLSKAEEVDSGLQDIVAGVAGVTEAMAQLETSSHEQREGIDQVTLAVAQVNEVTQQNAASAEEAASASEEMNAQAVHLQEIVSELMRVVSGTSARGGVPALDAPRRGAGTAQRSLG
jgi:methyl-accepting chemotaxis protein